MTGLDFLGADECGFDFMSLAKGAATALSSTGEAALSMRKGGVSKEAAKDDGAAARLEEEKRRADSEAARANVAKVAAAAGIAVAAVAAAVAAVATWRSK